MTLMNTERVEMLGRVYKCNTQAIHVELVGKDCAALGRLGPRYCEVNSFRVMSIGAMLKLKMARNTPCSFISFSFA